MIRCFFISLSLLIGINVFSGEHKTRARIDLNGKVKLVPKKGTDGLKAQNAPWVKDAEKRSCYLFFQGKNLNTEEWSDFEMVFIPQSDGEITINLMSNYYQVKDAEGKNKKMPLWVLWDDIKVEGADIVNGNFEEEAENGSPKGWHINKDRYIKKDGKKYIKAWHDRRATQKIKVKKGYQVRISAKTKACQ